MLEQLLPGLAHAQNVHPMFVHFPIALWLAAVPFWLVGAVRGGDAWRFGRWLVYLGVLSAALAVGTGLWATEQMGHETPGHDLVHVHRNFMLAAGGLGAVTALAAFLLRRREQRTGVRWGLVVLLLATASATMLGADRGGLLVFRWGVGVADEPPASASGHSHDDGHGDAAEPARGGQAEPAPGDTAQPSAPTPTVTRDGGGSARDETGARAEPSTGSAHGEHEHAH